MLRLSLSLACWIVLLVATGCGGAPADRTGGAGTGAATVIKIASNDHGGRDLDAFMHAVDELSDGELEIREIPKAHGSDVEGEREILADVRAGRVAMAKVAARAWDTAGIDDFAPLVAPFAITSLEQQERVLRSAVARKMLDGVGRLGLHGIALLPGDLRYPIGMTRDAARPEHFRGAVVGARASDTAARTFAALGGKTRALPPGSGLAGLDFAELDLQTLGNTEDVFEVRSVTANLPLWPRTQVVVMGQAAYDRLSDDQKHVLAKAARAAIGPSRRAIEKSSHSGNRLLCVNRAALVVATPADAAAFRKAVAPVLASLRRSDAAREALDAIDGMRAGTDTVRCVGQEKPRLEPEHVRTVLDGTWKADVTLDALLAAQPGPSEDDGANWGPLGLELDHGRFTITNARFPDEETTGEYVVRGHLIHFAPEGTLEEGAGEVWRYRWSRYRDTLTLHSASTEIPAALRAVPWVKER